MKDQQFQQWREMSEDRFPENYIERRLNKEDRKTKSVINRESRVIGKWFESNYLIRQALRFSGLRSKGRRNALDIQLRNNYFCIPTLPDEFNGYTILQLSDLHFNDHEGFLDRLLEKTGQIDFDLCVLTGDYRFRSFGPHEVAIESLSKLSQVINAETIAILGNHDSIKMVPEMEVAGITVLLNEHLVIKRASSRLLVAGVDDPHYYQTDDIEYYLSHLQPLDSTASILLAHSPEIYAEAENAGFNVYICGHTHGGQICIAPGKALVNNYRSPRWTSAGAWNHGAMLGYTSKGVGTSIVNARFNCAPEITLHTLVR